MTAAFSLGIFPGAMADLVVAPGVSPANGRGSNEMVTTGGNRHYQRGRKNPRTWSVSRPWQTPEFARVLGLAAHGLGGDMLLYDRACARQNLIPASRAVGAGAPVPAHIGPRGQELNPDPHGFVGGAWQSSSYLIGYDTVKVFEAAPRSAVFQRGSGTLVGPTLAPSNAIQVVVGRKYMLQAPVMALELANLPATGNGIRLTVTEYSASRTVLRSTVVGPNYTSSTWPGAGVWVQLGGSWVCPSDTAFVVLQVALTPTTAGLGSRFLFGEQSMRESLSAAVPLPSVDWSVITVPVLQGRTYVVCAHTSGGASPLEVTPPAGAVLASCRPDAFGRASYSFVASESGFMQIRRLATVTAVQVSEGGAGGLFYATEGTPTTVAVKDPERTYQLVTDTETRIDYTVELLEVGTYPGTITY